MDRLRVRQVPEGGGEQGKVEKTGCKINSAAPTTLAVKGLMMMMMTSQHLREYPILMLSSDTRSSLFIKCLQIVSLPLSKLYAFVVHTGKYFNL